MNAFRNERDGWLPAVPRRGVWIAWGLALQTVGVGIPVTLALRQASHDGLLSGLTHYTVRLIWHELTRSRADVALIVLGVLMFVAGAVVLARPFSSARSRCSSRCRSRRSPGLSCSA